jgi:hypothetical protein
MKARIVALLIFLIIVSGFLVYLVHQLINLATSLIITSFAFTLTLFIDFAIYNKIVSEDDGD